MKNITAICLLLLSTLSCAQQSVSFSVKEAWFTQAITPNEPNKGTFNQQYYILTPNAVADNPRANIHFVLGNENDATAQRLIDIYRAYGSPQDTIFAISEHRGYGQSTTADTQQKPTYVSLDAAVDDNSRLIKHLRETYQGKWIVNGCSYGGSLAIRYAELHPDTYDVAISSSAVIEYPALMPQYAEMVNKELDRELVARLSKHIQNLYAQKSDPEKMRQMEILHMLITGLAQVGSMQGLVPLAKKISQLPTSELVAELDKMLPPAGHNWANGMSSSTVPADSTKRNWYTWKYQMCYELGTFWVGYPYAMTKEDYVQRCQASFGEYPPYLKTQPKSFSASLHNVEKPIIVISGGKDPWINVGVKPNHDYSNIEYIYGENWHHCPDKDTPEATLQVKQKIKQLLQK